MTNAQFVRWTIASVWCRPEMSTSYMAGEWIKGLNAGFRIEGSRKVPVDRNTVVRYFLGLAQEWNTAELRRVESLKSSDPDAVPYRIL